MAISGVEAVASFFVSPMGILACKGDHPALTAAQTHITPILALGAEMFKLEVPSVIPDIVMMIRLAVRSKGGWPQ